MRQLQHEPQRALNRFGMGARIGEPAFIRDDPRGWLESQLSSGNAVIPTPGGTPAAGEVGAVLSQLLRAQQQRDTDAAQAARREIRQMANREVQAALGQRLHTEQPFVERLVAFWSNHLCVSVAAKPFRVGPLAGAYEREAIRPHVLGRFEDMVLSSARHPAMLFYLDNAQSIGPASIAGRRSRRGGNPRGLNENYARELMELHTLGVEGGYTQDDVIELARILTGWGVVGAGPQRPLGGANADRPAFRFFPAMHEPGPKTVLGVRYDGRGVREGEAVIHDLCRHPSTAQFVATKLVRHFVADEPPADTVASVAAVFRETEGNLLEVSRSLVGLDAAWEAQHRKFRTPQDWLIAALRAVGAPQVPPMMVGVLNQLRQPLWSPAAPKGYPDTRQEWADPDALMNRAELARSLADRLAGSGRDPEELLEVIEPDAARDRLAALLLDDGISRAERFALGLAGPAFQWR